MIIKEPKRRTFKSKFFFGVKALVAAEVAFLAGTYILWRKMNYSQDFRYKVHQRFPSLLNVYYSIGERVGDLPTRGYDYKAWGIEDD